MKTKERPNKKKLQEMHDNRSNWVFGFLYFNKEDKRILVPKKMPILGWTVNFANPYSIIPLCIVIILILIVRYYSMR